MPTTHSDLKRDWKRRLRAAFMDPCPSITKLHAEQEPDASRQELEEWTATHSVLVELLKIDKEVLDASPEKRPYGHKRVLHKLVASFQFKKPRINPDDSGYNSLWNKVVKKLYASDGGIEAAVAAIVRHPTKCNNQKYNREESAKIDNLLIANRQSPRDYPVSRLTPLIQAECEKLGLKPPSYEYLKKRARELNINFLTQGSRVSKDAERKAAIPMLSTYTEVDRERQGDGSRCGLPFDGNKFLKVYYCVDVASGKILGISFSEQEDWKIVHEAVKMSVGVTRTLPKKFLFDRGSGNKLFDSLYGNDLLKMGCKVEFAAPGYSQSRGKVEKFIDVFEQYFCNNIPGFILGIRNVRRVDRDLLHKEIGKKIYTKGQVIKLVTDQVNRYNSTKRKSGLSPDEMFDANRPQGNQLSEAEIAILFWEKTELQLRGPQVRLEYRRTKYTFDLPNDSSKELVDLLAEFYGSKVTVYFDVNQHDQIEETAYLIPNGDLKNLITLKQSIGVHRESELRTESQTIYYHKIMGLKAEVAAELKKRRTQAVEITKENFGERALALLHPLNTEKEELDNAENALIVNSVIERHGISQEERTYNGKVKKIEEVTPDQVTEVTPAPLTGNRWDDYVEDEPLMEPVPLKDASNDDYNTWRI